MIKGSNMESLNERTCINSKLLRQMYVLIVKIRKFEDKVAELYYEGKIITPIHLYTGQECAAVGVCVCLNKKDYVFGTHRSHGVYIAKGGSPKSLMAEILCRETGCSRGRGGSMHVVGPEVGIIGTSAIVGGILPLAVGTAFASATRKDGRVSVPFFGDGATDGGVFHESLNLASIYKLPVVFVCENNQYSSHLHLSFRQPRGDISRFAEVHSIPGFRVDGNDMLQVYAAARKAIKWARDGRGPSLIECIVNRWRGHVTPNWDYDVGLRSKRLIEEWKKNDPIKKFGKYLIDKKILSQSQIEGIHMKIDNEINEAVKFAEKSAYPPSNEIEAMKYVYKSRQES
jgi:pyruvate dehydrogenase E1 component alpha subunit